MSGSLLGRGTCDVGFKPPKQVPFYNYVAFFETVRKINAYALW